MKKLIAGNWKMHGNADMAEIFDNHMAECVLSHDHVEWLICPPFPYIASFLNVQRGAQNCSAHSQGAYTGEVSARMLADMGVNYCIVGHSERRQLYGENNAIVKLKAERLLEQAITPIICVGETAEEREEGLAFEVVKQQLSESVPGNVNANNCVIAYEPVWAIGTGKAATNCDVMKMHAYIHNILSEKYSDGKNIRILYGGSVKPDNAAEILNVDHVGGALIGGASLKVNDFIAIGTAIAA